MSYSIDKFRIKLKWLFLAVLFVFSACKEDLYVDKYERPEWLAGKVYTQVKVQPELSIFATCLELTGYDTIIDKSGSYTVFGPSNEAFETWLTKKQYNSVADVPAAYLEQLISYHLIQNPWSKIQLRTVDVYGWIDTLDESNNKARGFKRETFLKNDYKSFPLKIEDKVVTIVDESESNYLRKVIPDSRKFAPFFYSEYFSIYELNPSDYQFYFDRTFTGGDDLYFVNAKIISDEIKAENGFVYIIDQVVEPLQNAYQILEKKDGDFQYSKYLSLANLFPFFEYNEQKTNEQPGVEIGLEVDSLFDLTFPELAFDISNEETKPPSGLFGLPEEVTIRYHHGLMAPTNEALDQLINDYINVPGGWGSLERTPRNIKRIIANSHMAVNPVYPSDIERGFYNGENDIIHINAEDIVQKEFGSNCSFIGINKPIVPRAFSCVTGPVYLQPGFSRSMYAIEESGLLPALKRENKNYMFFVESDFSLQDDSSLIYNSIKEEFYLYMIQPMGGARKYNLNKNDLRSLFLNHVAIDLPKGIARKEYIPNLAGSYIIFNNVTGEVSGTSPTTIGYQGDTYAPNYPKKISEVSENGETYEIDNWFSFNAPNLYTEIQTSYPVFYALMKRAGLVLERQYRFNFTSDNEFYTVFIPSEAALISANVSALSNAELKELILLHFIQKDIIFTDGNKSSGYYETLRNVNPSSQNAGFTKIYIEPLTDVISIKAIDGSVYTEINESESTNKLTGVMEILENPLVFPNIYNNAVIHEIDKVLLINELDTN